MKTYFLKRYSFVVSVTALIIGFLFVIRILTHVSIPHLYIGIAFGLCLIFDFVLIKPVWFLLIPFSRKKLLAYHLFEVVLSSCTTVVLFAAAAVVFEQMDGQPFERYERWIAFGLVVFCSYIRLSTVIRQTAVQQVTLKYSNLLKSLMKPQVLAFATGAILFWWLGDGWLVGLGLLAWFVFIPVAGLIGIKMPASSLKIYFRNAFLIYLLAVAVVFGGVYSIVLRGSPNSAPAQVALMYLGHLPSFIHGEKAVEWFEAPLTFRSTAVDRIFQGSETKISEDQWKAKVGKCVTTDCLDFADSVTADGKSSVDGDLSRFAVLMSRCRPVIENNGKVRCAMARLSSPLLNTWLERLVHSTEATSWLKSDDVTLQVTAIKALTFETLNPEQDEIIKRLSQSENKILRSVAVDNLTFDRTRLRKSTPSACILF